MILCYVFRKVKPSTNQMPLPAREGRIVVFLYQELQAMVIGQKGDFGSSRIVHQNFMKRYIPNAKLTVPNYRV